MTARYRHIIWDWNGTILDDALLCVEILNAMLKLRGMGAVTHEDYQRHFDFPVIEYYRKLGFDFEAELYDAVAMEFLEAYDRGRFGCSLQAGARETIASFASAGMKQSVLSAYQQRRLEESVAKFGLGDYFTTVSGLSDCYAHSKLDNGRELIAELGCKADEVLLIGDTTHDADVAEAMGVDCMLLVAGHQHPDKLRRRTANVFSSLREILGLISD